MDDQDRTRSGVLSDEGLQLSVLSCVLALHPDRLSVAELRRQIFVDDHEFSQVEAYDRAVRDLVAVGLLRHDGDSVIATRAASYFARLRW